MNVVAKGVTAGGDPVQVVGAGDLARCLQHETDHLDGVLFIDRLDRDRRKTAMRAIRGRMERHHACGQDQPAPDGQRLYLISIIVPVRAPRRSVLRIQAARGVLQR